MSVDVDANVLGGKPDAVRDHLANTIGLVQGRSCISVQLLADSVDVVHRARHGSAAFFD